MRVNTSYQIAFLLLLVPLLCSCTPSTRRLATIEEEFFARKTDYVALYDLFVEDRLQEVTFDEYRTQIDKYYTSGDGWFDESNEAIAFPDVLRDIGITELRFAQYRDLMGNLGVRTIQQRTACAVCFYKEGFGVLDGYFIEIVNTTGEVSGTTVSSVHDVPTEEEGEYFVPLDGNWYLKYVFSQ